MADQDDDVDDQMADEIAAETADEGMDDPVVLRGLLQCVMLFSLCTTRYLLDVVLSPRAVQSIWHHAVLFMRWLWRAACCAIYNVQWGCCGMFMG